MVNLFGDRQYSVIEVGLIKWSCILFGMVAGAYLADFVLRYVWLFVIVAVLLAVKPIISYFKEP